MNLTLTDKLRLLSKGDTSFIKQSYQQPTIIGDFQFEMQVKQKPGLIPTSHTNSLMVQSSCDIKWYRLNHQCEQLVGEGHVYQFEVNDIGSIIKARVVSLQQGSATILLGPILIDKSLRLLLDNTLTGGASKFSFTLKGMSLTGQQKIKLLEIRELDLFSSIYITQRQIKVVTQRKNQEISQTLNFSLNSPILIIEENNRVTLQFNDEFLSFVEQMQPQRYSKIDSIQLTLESASSVQRDLFVLTLRLFASKQKIENLKYFESLDKYMQGCNSLFGETPMHFQSLKFPGDLLLIIQQQDNQLKSYVQKNEILEQQIINCHLQVKAFEAEMQETLNSYQSLLQQNNSSNFTDFESIKDSNLGQSVRTLKNRVVNLKSQLDLMKGQNLKEMDVFSYQGQSTQQLTQKINELNSKLTKSRRLNELLNEELQSHNSTSKDENLQGEFLQLKQENELVHTYHKQLVEQDILIKELRQSRQHPQSFNLEEENKNLRMQVEQMKIQASQQNSNTYQIENEQLQESYQYLQKKNESLLKEIDLLIKSPNQIKVLQHQAAQNHLDQNIKNLQKKIQELQAENLELREQNQVKIYFQICEQFLMMAREKRQSLHTSESQNSPSRRQRSSGSAHGIFMQLPPFPKKQKSNIFPGKAQLILQDDAKARTSKNFGGNSVISQYEQLIGGNQFKLQ